MYSRRHMQAVILPLTLSLNPNSHPSCQQPRTSVSSADNVFLGEIGHVPELGALLWPRLAAAYIEARLAPALPEDDTDLTAFDRVRRAPQLSSNARFN